MPDASDEIRRISDGWQRAYREAVDGWQQLHDRTLQHWRNTGWWMAFFGMLAVLEACVIFYLLLVIERS